MEVRGQRKARDAAALFQYHSNRGMATDLTRIGSSGYIHSFVNSNKCLVSTCSVPNTVVGAGDKQ